MSQFASLFLLWTVLSLTSPSLMAERTIESCLLASGFSGRVLDRHEFVSLVGSDAWPDPRKSALKEGEWLGNVYIQTDTGERKAALILYTGKLFVFVYKHPDDPTAFEVQPDQSLAWHGDCMLQLRLP